MLRVVLRTPEEKADLVGSWARADEDFFGSGACHVLAGAFLQAYPSSGFRALMIRPTNGARGGHVIVADETTVFDCRGWNRRDDFLCRYALALCAVYPGWSYTLASSDDPMGWEFCRMHNHRHPSEFVRDPVLRAKGFLQRFPKPGVLAVPPRCT
jgi:hypothetical protein